MRCHLLLALLDRLAPVVHSLHSGLAWLLLVHGLAFTPRPPSPLGKGPVLPWVGAES